MCLFLLPVAWEWWCFQDVLFINPETWGGRWSHFDWYASNGLKPPTGYVIHDYFGAFGKSTQGVSPWKKKTSSDPKHILKISLEKRSMFFDDSEDDSMMKKKRRGSRKGTHSGSHCGFIYLVWFPIIIIICPLWIQVPPKKILKTPQIVP